MTLLQRLIVVGLALAFLWGALTAHAGSPQATLTAAAAAASPSWSNVTPSTSPVPMAGAMMAYSSRADRFVLFGGWDGVSGLNGTWAFDPLNRTWTELHPARSPMSRGDEMFVYDTRSDLFILFGGWYEFPNGSYMRLADTWTFSLGTTTWVERNPSTAPSARSDAEVAYDPAADAVLLVGGFSGTRYLGDVWAYSPTNDTWWPRGSAAAPSPRADGRMVYVTSQDRFLLFGGNDYNGPNFSFHHLNDTWSYRWTENAWTLLPTTTAPAARDYPIFSVDASAGVVLLTAGYGNSTILNDLWGLNLTTDTWSDLTPTASPPARFAAAGGFDSADNAFVLFSGAGNNGLLSDTWYYGHAPPAPSNGGAGLLGLIGAGLGATLLATVGIYVAISRRRRSP